MDIVEDCEYAWFVASGTVKAEGMKVQAQSEGNLVIRYLEGNWGTSATADMNDFQSLKPTSSYDLSTWVYSSAAAATGSTSDGKYSNVTTNVNPTVDDKNNPNDYALVKKFQIRSATADANSLAKGLYVDSIEVTLPAGTAPTQNLSSSLRVGIKCIAGDVTTNAIYGPVGSGEGNTPTDGYTVKVPGTGDTFTDQTVTLKQQGWNADTSKPNFANVAEGTTIPNKDGTPVDVWIYVWFEGEDTHLYSDNFSAESMNIAVNFQSCSSKATV